MKGYCYLINMVNYGAIDKIINCKHLMKDQKQKNSQK